jgi:hypothetical protein
MAIVQASTKRSCTPKITIAYGARASGPEVCAPRIRPAASSTAKPAIATDSWRRTGTASISESSSSPSSCPVRPMTPDSDCGAPA